jgi:nicotinate-nucleotide adenylyltransferase
MTIGLYGGTFNPPHKGHRLVSLMALRRLGLDRVWWMVTPGNPLKDKTGLPTAAARASEARALAGSAQIDVTTFEERIGARYTIDTLRFLKRRYPGVRFVWIMGADNLAGFDRWHGWREIAEIMPIAVIDRPGWTLKAVRSRAAVALAENRLPEAQAKALPQAKRPAWIFLHGPRSHLSSTRLRQLGQ